MRYFVVEDADFIVVVSQIIFDKRSGADRKFRFRSWGIVILSVFWVCISFLAFNSDL